MRIPARRFVACGVVALLAACSRGSGSSSPRPVDHNLITQEQIREHRFTNAYEAVAALRSNWLLTRGPDSFSNPSQVLVYFDATRLGGIETLRSIATTTVVYIRYYDGISASGRWGLDHGQGVIFVSSREE